MKNCVRRNELGLSYLCKNRRMQIQKISKPPQKSCTIVAGVQTFLLRKEIVVVSPTATVDKLLTQTRVGVVVPAGEVGHA